MTTSPKTLWNRNLTAAKRSLKLVLETGQEHLDILEGGEVPEGSFAPSFTKYLEALGNLRVLDSLGENGDGDNGEATIEVRADALEALVLFAHGFVTEAGRQPGSPIDELTRAVYPDGIVPAEEPS